METAEVLLGATCQICLWPIDSAQQACVCPGCKASYHNECWKELRGCAVYGCPNMVEVTKVEASVAFWGSTEKLCPWCKESIPIGVVECPFCKENFPDIRPMSDADIIPRPVDLSAQRFRKKAVWLLIFSSLGFTSPFALLIGSIWYRSNREEIERSGSTTKTLTLVSLGICGLYLAVVMLGLLVFFHSGH